MSDNYFHLEKDIIFQAKIQKYFPFWRNATTRFLKFIVKRVTYKERDCNGDLELLELNLITYKRIKDAFGAPSNLLGLMWSPNMYLNVFKGIESLSQTLIF